MGNNYSQEPTTACGFCPSILLEQLGLADREFILADQLIEAQNERRARQAEDNQQSSRDDVSEIMQSVDSMAISSPDDGISTSSQPSSATKSRGTKSSPDTSYKKKPECSPHFYRDDLLITKICPEIGLHSQRFKCVDCDASINLDCSRLCHYDGRYYCCDCHTGTDLLPIPARVLGSWDLAPKPVSRRSLRKINFMREKLVLFNLFQFNSMLYGFIERLVDIKHTRERIQSMLRYLEVCGQAERPNLEVVSKHFLNADLLNFFTLNDLCDINQVYETLNQLQSNLENHIVRKCESCRGKGFYCELCKDPKDILYPFSINSASCKKCHTVFHKICFQRKRKNCSRCLRMNLKKKSAGNHGSDSESGSSD